MGTAAKKLMTASEFLGWVASRPKHPRHELIGGLVIEMAAERAVHARLKREISGQIYNQLPRGGPCELFLDGMAVQVDDQNVFEPDAFIQCVRPDNDVRIATEPVVVIEILSPSTRAADLRIKVPAYMKMPTVKALVLFDPERRLAAVHWGDSGNSGKMTEHAETEVIQIDLGMGRGAPIRLDLGLIWAEIAE